MFQTKIHVKPFEEDVRYQQGLIYKICAPDGCFYIGSTIQTMYARFHGHKDAMKHGEVGKAYDHFRACGVDKMVIALVEQYPCDSEADLKEREAYWIRHFQGPNLLNKQIPAASRKPNRYQDAKIYALYHEDLCAIYIGSTVQSLACRLSSHKSDFKRGVRKTSVCKLADSIEDGMDRLMIVKIEDYPCNNIKQLQEREQFWLERIPEEMLINEHSAILTDKQRKKNKLVYMKEYNKRPNVVQNLQNRKAQMTEEDKEKRRARDRARPRNPRKAQRAAQQKKLKRQGETKQQRENRLAANRIISRAIYEKTKDIQNAKRHVRLANLGKDVTQFARAKYSLYFDDDSQSWKTHLCN